MTITCCPNPREIVAYLPGGQADLVLRGAARSSRSSRPAWRRIWPRRASRPPGGWRRRAGRSSSSRRAIRSPTDVAAGAAEGRRGVVRRAARDARPRRGDRGQRRRRADAARRARVLPRDRDPDRRAAGGCRRPAASARSTRPGGCGSAPSGRRRSGVELRLADDGELLVRGDVVMTGYRNAARADGRGDRPRRLAAHRRHRRDRRATATSGSSTARRSSSSTRRARTCRPRTSSRRSRAPGR